MAGERLKRAIGLGLLAFGLGLAACQDGGVTGMTGSVPRVAPLGVPIAIETIEGAPDAVLTPLREQVVDQASVRRIDLVAGAADPRYRLRGYVSAFPSDDGNTHLALVWDVFDPANQRARRVSTTVVAKGQAEDPWARIGSRQLASAAADSMNDIAGFLAGSAAPETNERARPQTGLAFSAAE